MFLHTFRGLFYIIPVATISLLSVYSVDCTDDDNNYDNKYDKNYDKNYENNYDQASAERDVVAGTQNWTCGNRDPQPCDFGEWVVNNWWTSAVESFNFASRNWEEFTNSIESVSRTDHCFKEK